MWKYNSDLGSKSLVKIIASTHVIIVMKLFLKLTNGLSHSTLSYDLSQYTSTLHVACNYCDEIISEINKWSVT